MNNFSFCTALLDSMFPGDPKRNWKSYSAWVGTETIFSLPHLAEIEQALMAIYSSPTEVGCECLESNLMSKSQINELCLQAITDYFSHVSN